MKKLFLGSLSAWLLVSTVGLTAGCKSEDEAGGAGGGGGEAADESGQGAATQTECEAAADAALADDCDSGRVCNYKLARSLCASGDAAATLDVTECLRADGACHTPSDPGNDDVRGCLDAAISEHGSAASTAVRATIGEACADGPDYVSLMFETYAIMAGPTQAAELEACVKAAADCDAAQSCILSDLGVPVPEEC